MAAPSKTSPETPTGWKMPEGHRILVVFKNKPNVGLWIVSVKPPKLEIGQLDTTTQHNVRVETGDAPALIKYGELTGKCRFDPDAYADILGLLGVVQSISIWWPNGADLTFWGHLGMFDYDEMKNKTPPEASFTIYVDNQDPAANNVESPPVYSPVAGT